MLMGSTHSAKPADEWYRDNSEQGPRRGTRKAGPDVSGGDTDFDPTIMRSFSNVKIIDAAFVVNL